MTTFPLDTLACTIDATGISSPSYADIYTSLQASLKSIYGSDTYIDPDSQDGQQLAIYAQGQYDSNQATIAAYNNFSPATAFGAGLSSVVKINGLQREVPTNSTADLTIGGTAGSPIANGLVGDNANLGTQWALPALVTIPFSGSIVVTATCTQPGAVSAAPGTLTKILNPQLGWQTVTNVSNASIGEPVEKDATLRQRQSISTGLPAQTPLQSITANVADIPGVTRVQPYENDTGTTDGNSIPGHSISLVVEGGSAMDITNAIAAKKNPGCGTFGTTSEIVFDPAGVPDTINFFVLAYEQIYISLTIAPLVGFTTAIGTYIIAALVQYINTLPIGGTVYYNRLWAPANLQGSAAIAAVSAILQTPVTQAQLDAFSATFDVTVLTVGTAPAPVGVVDVVVPFNEVGQTQTAHVLLTT